MMLLLDLGNTRLKWQMWDAEHALAPMQALTYSEDISSWQPLFDSVAHLRFSCIWLSSVAGSRAEPLLALLQQHFGAMVRQAKTPASLLGLVNAYAEPERLGIDRFLGMLGARALMPERDVLVALAGTALTLDVVQASGSHLGGLIIPGPKLMRSSLHRQTANLPDAPGLLRGLGRSTADAMYTGSIRACAALLHELADEHADAAIVMSGGAAAQIWPAISTSLHTRTQLAPELVLRGLQQYARTHAL
jgi:type III pantothenate kinase